MSAVTTASTSVSESDLPALYRAWGDLSQAGQREHLAKHRLLLLLLVAGAVVSALSSIVEPFARNSGSDHWLRVHDIIRTSLAIAACAALAGSLQLTSFLRSANHSTDWYDGRALAESAKSMAWKYMMRAEPYGAVLSGAEADGLLCSDLQALLADVKGQALPAHDPSGGGQITPRMREVRRLIPTERFAVYLRDRIHDQQAWYTRRSKKHREEANKWARLAVAMNTGALALSLLSIVWIPAGAAVGIVTTAASSVLAWTQIRRFDELAHAYAFTSHEIALLHARSHTAGSDDDLARFVADCETAFSREHTMWRARRELAQS